MSDRKSYLELSRFETFEERFQYLSLRGQVGDATFGSRRFENQSFYTSSEWRKARNVVIIRDNGADLGIPGREIRNILYVHHINPLTIRDIETNSYALIDPDNLITVSHRTHNAIHYGDENQLEKMFVERTPGDTKDW